MSSPLILVATGSVVVTYYGLVKLASSPWWVVPIYVGLFLAWNGYRILIYQRYLNPLSHIPGPKVCASLSSDDNSRDTGSGESFELCSRRSLGKRISDGSGNIGTRQASSHFLDYSILAKSCQHPMSLFNILQVIRRFMLNRNSPE